MGCLADPGGVWGSSLQDPRADSRGGFGRVALLVCHRRVRETRPDRATLRRRKERRVCPGFDPNPAFKERGLARTEREVGRVVERPSECDDIIRRAHVRINRRWQAGSCPERQVIWGRSTPSVFSSRFLVYIYPVLYIYKYLLFTGPPLSEMRMRTVLSIIPAASNAMVTFPTP